MKLLIWFIIITLWCINYNVWLSYSEKSNKKTILLIISIIIQIVIMSLLIWSFNSLYYKEHSFIYVILDVVSYGFIFLLITALITCIICGTYKAIGHRYIDKFKKTSNYDISQFITNTENADKKIDKFFSSHIFYLIFTIVCLWQIPLIFK